MRGNTPVVFEVTRRRPALGRVLPSVCGVMALAFTFGCTTTPVEPATPTLISVEGHGTFDSVNNVFRFANPVRDETTSPATVTHHTGTRVRFKVPYPTSIELAIDGKPLTQVDGPTWREYKYGGTIENPGGNPVAWRVGIQTPLDVPVYGTASKPMLYHLTIVNVSGSKRSQPLTIHYQQPTLYFPSPIPGSSSSPPENHQSDTQSGPCAGGAPQREIQICFSHPSHLSQPVTISSCSYAEALKLFANVYPAPEWSHTQGPCP